MKDDELISALARAAREKDWLADRRWDALAEGSLSEEERATLLEEAQRSEERCEAFEAFRPLDEGARERIAGRLLEKIGQGGAAQVIPFPKRRRVLAAILTASSIAAAAAVFVFAFRSGGGPLIPAYELSVEGGERDLRSVTENNSKGPLRLGPGSRLEMTLRPSSDVNGPIAVRAFVVPISRALGEEPREWTPPIEIAPGGSARIAGSKEALFPGAPDGEVEILVAVGRKDALPESAGAMQKAANEQKDAREGEAKGVFVFRLRVLLHDGGDGGGR